MTQFLPPLRHRIGIGQTTIPLRSVLWFTNKFIASQFRNILFILQFINFISLYLPRFDWINVNFIIICEKCICRFMMMRCSIPPPAQLKSKMHLFNCSVEYAEFIACRVYRSTYTRILAAPTTSRANYCNCYSIRLFASVSWLHVRSSRLSCDDCAAVCARMKWVTSSVQGHLRRVHKYIWLPQIRMQAPEIYSNIYVSPALNQTVLIDFNFQRVRRLASDLIIDCRLIKQFCSASI